MKNPLFALSLLVATFANLFLNAEPFPEGMVVIGDSISDVGNTPDIGPLGPIANALSPITNGQTWPVFVYYHLGLGTALTPSTEGGAGFAQSGAITNIFNPALGIQSILSQAAAIPSSFSRDFPVFIEGGYNDVNFTMRTGSEGAAAFMEVIKAVGQKKFKYRIVFNLFDIGRAPTNNATAEAVTSYVNSFNQSLRNLVGQEKEAVLLVNFYALANDILDNPGKYHFTNTTIATPLNSSPAGFFFFYDGIHPTEAVYRILADYVSSMLLAPPCVGALAEVPFSQARQHNASLKQQLFPLQPRHLEKKIYPFIAGNYVPLLEHETFAKTKQQANGGEVIAGFTDRIAEHWTLGLAGSYSRDHNKCGSNFSYSLANGAASLFGVYHPARGYIRGIADVCWLRYSDIDRQFFLGPVKNRTHAKTSGRLYGGFLDGAYFVIKQGETIYSGPLVTFEYQYARVDGFKESGADFGNLAYKHQNSHSFVTGLGWEVDWNYKPEKIQYGVNGSISVNRQWIKNSRELRFRETSLPEGLAKWPYDSERFTYASGLVNAYTEFANHFVLSLGYLFNIGSSRLSEQVVTLGMTMPIGK